MDEQIAQLLVRHLRRADVPDPAGRAAELVQAQPAAVVSVEVLEQRIWVLAARRRVSLRPKLALQELDSVVHFFERPHPRIARPCGSDGIVVCRRLPRPPGWGRRAARAAPGATATPRAQRRLCGRRAWGAALDLSHHRVRHCRRPSRVQFVLDERGVRERLRQLARRSSSPFEGVNGGRRTSRGALGHRAHTLARHRVRLRPSLAAQARLFD